MKKEMRAMYLAENNEVKIQSVTTPQKAEAGHLLLKMEACAINPGDRAFIGGAFPGGSLPVSQHNILGVSGVGKVIEIGEGVSKEYEGKNVTVYRSLKFSESMVGTWCEYAHLPYLQCAILPDTLIAADYAGSLVNVITPYAFLKQIIEEEHKGIVCTAGTSATGIAMLGICRAYDFPLISIVRDEKGKQELEELGAKNIIVQSDADFKLQLKDKAQSLAATAVFDGVGGELLTKIVDALPVNSTVYCYGFLGGQAPLSLHTSALMKGLTLKSFGNFKTKTVQTPELLEAALKDISGIISMPHFKTKIGKKFKLEEIQEALKFTSVDGGKAVLVFE